MPVFDKTERNKWSIFDKTERNNHPFFDKTERNEGHCRCEGRHSFTLIWYKTERIFGRFVTNYYLCIPILRKSIASAFVQGEDETDKTTALGLRAGMAQMDK